jgi:uncharacterized repeat protein (TIGR01451 family)
MMKTNIVRWLPIATVFIVLLATLPMLFGQYTNHSVAATAAQTDNESDGAYYNLALSPSALPAPTATNEEQGATLNGVQGVVQLKVKMPTYIKAGEDIRYTYTYTNTGTSDVSDMEIEVKWVNFALKPTTETSIYQFCQDDCGIVTGSVSGPAVTMKTAVNERGVGRVSVGTLAAGKSGQFSILLTSNKAVFPRTNESIIRPSGSGRLFLGSSKQPTSEDTNNTMVVGPVLSVIKKATSTGKIYPMREANFTLSVGNATGSGDIVDGHIRGDARKATGIQVVDSFPVGSEFVKATGDYKVNTTDRTVTWSIAGPLEPGESQEVSVTYKKQDVAESCDAVRNDSYTITSSEMPYQEDDKRYTVAGTSVATIGLIQPLVIKSVAASPSSLPVGDAAAITIVVQNFYDTAINGAELEYSLPTDVLYTSSTPAAGTVPTGSTPGGTVMWKFDMSAGSISTPSEKSFTITIKGTFTDNGSNGTATIRAPHPVPSACLASVNGGAVTLTPRLSVRKSTNGEFLVMRGDKYPYNVEITNKASQPVSGVSLTDVLPGEPSKNACFSYVQGSATINGVAAAPTKGGTGCGTLTWNNLTIPANSTVTLAYELEVNGHYFATYCNKIVASRGDETITHQEDSVCTRINPNLKIEKSVNNNSVSPGDEVIYTIRLTNYEEESYSVGLYDLLDESVNFVRHVSGYAQPTVNGQEILWKRQSLAPGQSIEVSFAAKMPDGCYNTRTFQNSALFQIESLGEVIIVKRDPELIVKVTVNQPPGCVPIPPSPTPTPTWDPNQPTPTPAPKLIRYSFDTDRTDVSLKDRLFYTISLQNVSNQDAVKQVKAEVVLPEGFIFAETSPESTIESRPRIEKTQNNETKLTWYISSIDASETAIIRFKTLSSDVVGQYDSSLVVEIPEDWKSETSSATSVTTMVKPLMTIAPSIMGGSQECRQSGAAATYQVVLLNTNTHSYLTTTVAMSMPIGLSFIGVSDTTPYPDDIRSSIDGATTLIWNNVAVPARPSGQAFTQVVFEVNLQVGKVWDTLQVHAEATSPDGLIPRKEDVVDAEVQVCPPEIPSFGKTANTETVWRNTEHIVYKLTLVNPTSAPIAGVTVQDTLPEGLAYVQMVSGPEPTLITATNQLEWSNLTVPAGSGTPLGEMELKYEVKVLSWQEGQQLRNIAQIVVPSGVFESEQVGDPIKVQRPVYLEQNTVYLPIIQRSAGK